MANKWNLRQDLLSLTDGQFELAVGVVLYESGWEVVHTGFGSDGGYDFKISAQERAGVVEVKHTTQSVSPKDVRATTGSAIENQVQELSVISMRGFTSGAIETANRIDQNPLINSIQLINGDDLVEAIAKIDDISEIVGEISEEDVDPEILFGGQTRLQDFSKYLEGPLSKENERYKRAKRLSEKQSLFV